MPLILAVLTGIGELLLKTGQDKAGKRLLVNVQHHPAVEYITRERAEDALKSDAWQPSGEPAADLDAVIVLARTVIRRVR